MLCFYTACCNPQSVNFQPQVSVILLLFCFPTNFYLAQKLLSKPFPSQSFRSFFIPLFKVVEQLFLLSFAFPPRGQSEGVGTSDPHQPSSCCYSFPFFYYSATSRSAVAYSRRCSSQSTIRPLLRATLILLVPRADPYGLITFNVFLYAPHNKQECEFSIMVPTPAPLPPP